MAGYITTVYASSVVWNSITWNGDPSAGAGGLIRVMLSHPSTDIQDRTGTQEYPEFVQMVNKGGMVSVTLREVKQISELGTKSNMTVNLSGKGGTPSIACVGMILRDVNMSQGRGEPGEATLTFIHESADGTTVPYS